MEIFYANLDEVIDENSFGGALKEFHEDFRYPVYKENKIPEDDKILNITRSAGKIMLYVLHSNFIELSLHYLLERYACVKTIKNCEEKKYIAV